MPLWARQTLITASPLDAEAGIEGHRAHLRELEARGILVLTAEYRHGDGFLEIYEAADLHEAERIARSSPLVEDGLGSWTLRSVVEARLPLR